ncbi:unnamed protein product [Rotaria sp. Silwood2]|nr:unnamed protein product [Rotaria sp. Silwood2]
MQLKFFDIKFNINFDELPVEHCKALCDSLLDHLSRIELTRNTTVRVQLAVATADLALQYVGWEKPVEDVVEKLKTSSEHMLTLLEFLTALPEELNTSTIRIGENRRQYCREKYSNCGKQIHEILIFLLQVNPSHNELLFIDILKYILKSTNCSNELHKSPYDCLCDIFELCESYQKHWSFAVYLKQQITQYLCQPYSQAVIDENLDKAQDYTRIYTNLIESILECLVDGRQLDLSDLSCLHLLLYPLEHSDYEVVQSTLYTWYHLGELIQTNNEFIIDKVKSYMDKLVDVLCTQCKLDPDHLGIPPETDEKSSKNNGTSNSDLSEFRYRVQCFIEDTIYITGSLNCFQCLSSFSFLLFQKNLFFIYFKKMFDKLQSSSSLSWEEKMKRHFPNVIQAIISTPIQTGIVHTAIKYTGVRLISQLENWIAKNDQQILKSIIQYLLSLLVDKELRHISADTILIISQQGRKQLLNDLDQIIQATLWLDLIDNGSDAAQCLLKALSKIISRLTSIDDIHRYLKLLFDQQIQSITQILSTQSDTNYSSITKRLDCLTAIFKSLDFKTTHEEIHPCITIVQQFLPLLNLIIVRYRSLGKLSECWSCTIRFIIRSMRSHAKIFFQPIVELVISSYDDVPHSCFLYLISIIIDEYGNDQDLKSSIIVMSEHLTTKTFSILNKPDGFKENSDLVDFYRLSSRLLQRCPLEYRKSSVIQPIIEQIIPNYHLEHRDAKIKNKSELSEIRSLSMSLCETYISNLLTALIRAIVISHVPSSIRSSISEFVCEIKIYMSDKFPQWLQKSLTEIPRTSKNGLVEIVTSKQHEQFYKALCESDTQSSTIDYELETFAKLYR